MEQSKFKTLLNRYLKGKANETETALVEAWYKSYQNTEIEINVSEDEKEASKKAIKEHLKTLETPKIRSIKPLIYRLVAAIAIISTIASLFFNWSLKKQQQVAINFTTVTTVNQQIKKIILPDSSIVWLNAASEMRVADNFEGKTRDIYLDEGEAYFEVTKNPKKPFIVHSPQIKVQVLGTSFNINAYKNLPTVKVAVSTGKVKVDDSEKNLTVLIKKQQLSYNKQTKTAIQSEVNDEEVKQWREGKIYLHQASFKELALILKNNFNLELLAGSQKVNNYQFTLNISSDMTENQILNIISAIHNSNLRKEGNKVTLY